MAGRFNQEENPGPSARFLPMPRQACIFCERATPLVMITREHLFSRWVDDVLTPGLLGPDRTFERTTVSPGGAPQTKTWPTGVVAAIEAPVVCGGCNGGWMSGLDGQARHLLEPMMLGQPRTLPPQEQLTIAAWAAVKSVVLEYIWGAEQVIVLPQAARTFVFRQRRPPENMQIRIAAAQLARKPGQPGTSAALHATCVTSSATRTATAHRAARQARPSITPACAAAP